MVLDFHFLNLANFVFYVFFYSYKKKTIFYDFRKNDTYKEKTRVFCHYFTINLKSLKIKILISGD